jgi:hypothetical protein
MENIYDGAEDQDSLNNTIASQAKRVKGNHGKIDPEAIF